MVMLDRHRGWDEKGELSLFELILLDLVVERDTIDPQLLS